MQGNYDLLRQAIRQRQPVIAFMKDASGYFVRMCSTKRGEARPRIPVRRRKCHGAAGRRRVALHAGSGSDCDTPAQRPWRGNRLTRGQAHVDTVDIETPS